MSYRKIKGHILVCEVEYYLKSASGGKKAIARAVVGRLLKEL